MHGGVPFAGADGQAGFRAMDRPGVGIRLEHLVLVGVGTGPDRTGRARRGRRVLRRLPFDCLAKVVPQVLSVQRGPAFK